jgi:hypothetical protein
MNTTFLISCSSKKLDYPCEAQDLYASPLFTLSLQYAKQQQPEHIFILSAKHGLVALDQILEPYNQTLNDMPLTQISEWADSVHVQLKRSVNLNETTITLLAGERYTRFLLPHFPHHSLPLLGLGIGKRLQWLKRNIHE